MIEAKFQWFLGGINDKKEVFDLTFPDLYLKLSIYIPLKYLKRDLHDLLSNLQDIFGSEHIELRQHLVCTVVQSKKL